MKNAIGLIFAGLLVFIMPAAQAAQKSAGALRNLDWAGATVDKIEKDLAEFIQVNKLPTSNALAAAIQKARAKLSDLKSIVTVIEPGPEDLGKVMNYTKNLSNLAQTIMDRISDLDGKREAYRKLIADNPPLAKTDFGKRFDDEFRLLGESLVRLTACQLESKPIEAGEAEGAWNLQALRCDQMMEEGSEEAAYLARKEELKNSIREAGKTISLAPLDDAREQVRAIKRRQQELAAEKQKQADHINLLNLQNQAMDEKASKLNEAADKVREAYEKAQEKIQQAIEAEAQK